MQQKPTSKKNPDKTKTQTHLFPQNPPKQTNPMPKLSFFLCVKIWYGSCFMNFQWVVVFCWHLYLVSDPHQYLLGVALKLLTHIQYRVPPLSTNAWKVSSLTQSLSDCYFDPISPSWVKCKLKIRLLESCYVKDCVLLYVGARQTPCVRAAWQRCLGRQFRSVCAPCAAGTGTCLRNPGVIAGVLGGEEFLEAPAEARRLTNKKFKVRTLLGAADLRNWLFFFFSPVQKAVLGKIM